MQTPRLPQGVLPGQLVPAVLLGRLPEEGAQGEAAEEEAGGEMTHPDTDYGNFKVGTIVNYWRGKREGAPDGQGVITDTGEMCGTKVAWIEGCRGCIALSHLALIKL
jgi:hypothetical protein